MAIIRAHRLAGSAVPIRLIYSIRDPGEVWYRDELSENTGLGTAVQLVHTRVAPPGSSRPAGRITAEDLLPPEEYERTAVCFVCGPTGFVEHAANLLTSAGYAPDRIRTERFG
ncbi:MULTISPECIES: hypothetical protein [unclassified Streptomyces]